MQIENPIILGRIERVDEVPTFKTIEAIEYFHDIYGSVIVRNDEYMILGGEVIHADNLYKHLEERFNAKFCTYEY